MGTRLRGVCWRYVRLAAVLLVSVTHGGCSETAPSAAAQPASGLHWHPDVSSDPAKQYDDSYVLDITEELSDLDQSTNVDAAIAMLGAYMCHPNRGVRGTAIAALSDICRTWTLSEESRHLIAVLLSEKALHDEDPALQGHALTVIDVARLYEFDFVAKRVASLAETDYSSQSETELARQAAGILAKAR